MKVGLWGKIRRLAEIEQLSARVISRRLHCSWRTVDQALELKQPPALPVPNRVSRFDPYKVKIDAPLANIPISRRCASTRKLLAAPMATPAVSITVRHYLR